MLGSALLLPRGVRVERASGIGRVRSFAAKCSCRSSSWLFSTRSLVSYRPLARGISFTALLSHAVTRAFHPERRISVIVGRPSEEGQRRP